MPERKRVFLWIGGGIGIILVLFAAILILLPRLIDSDRLRAKIAKEVSSAVDGTVEIRKLGLSYWPKPNITFQGVKLDIPGAATGSMQSLTAYPRILSLFRGKILLSYIRLEAPEFAVTIPERSETPFVERLRSFLDSMARSAPDLRVVLTDGRLDLSGRGLPPLSFRDVEAKGVLPPDGPSIDLSCAGTLWEHGSLNGRFDPGSLSGKARIVLKGFQPHVLERALFPGSGAGISDSDVDLDFRMDMEGTAKIRLEGDLSFTRIAVKLGKKGVELSGGTVQGNLERNGKTIKAALTRLSLESPRLLLSGNLFLNGETGQSHADAQAREVDIAILREHALALAGDVPLVKEIFSIVHAGTIPALSFRAEGKSAGDLWELENMEFAGRIDDGAVTVDAGEADLTIEKIQGDLALRRGFLEARNLEGNMGKSSARLGTLRMGFLGPDPPFHLETYIAADLSELPPLLHQLVPAESFRKELSRVEEVSGNARGRLILGETVDSIKVAAEIDAMSLSAKILGLPSPLAVSGGQLLYREEEIAVTGAKGRFGQTGFSDLSGNIRMADPSSLKIQSGTIRLFLDELFPWARKAESLREPLANVESVSGTVTLSVNRLEGLLLAPGEWDFDLSGDVEHLSLSTPSVHGPIEMPRGSFRATPDSLRFENLIANFLDSSVFASGSVEAWRTDAPSGVITGGGRSGPGMIGFLADRGKIPPGFAVRPPLEASGVRLEWQKDSLVALAGDFRIGDGVKVSVDIFRPPGEWVIRNLSLHDRDSRASLSLHWKPESLDLTFQGNLSGAITQRIFVSGSPAEGRIEGNFRASLRFDDPVQSSALGSLEGENLRFLERMGIPVFIEGISLSAEDSRVAIRSAEITVGKTHVSCVGEATASSDGLTFEVEASTPGIDWESLHESFATPEANKGAPRSEGETGESRWDAPVRGTVRLKSGYFRYGGHTIEPANAVIALGASKTTLAITDAAYCGIPFTGTIRTSDGEVSFELWPAATEQDIETSYACLTMEKGKVTGRFDLAGEFSGRVREAEQTTRSLRGNLNFTGRDGRVYGNPMFSRLLSLLRPTEIFKDRLPDSREEGIDYNTFSIRAEKGEGSVVSLESIFKGSTIEMVGSGGIDLSAGECDIQILVAPTTRINTVIRKIPVLGYILGGTLVQVPVRVSGAVEDPRVSLLEPAAVGRNLLGIAERTFLLPVKLFQPALPGEKNPVP